MAWRLFRLSLRSLASAPVLANAPVVALAAGRRGWRPCLQANCGPALLHFETPALRFGASKLVGAPLPAHSVETASGFRWLETVDEAFEAMLPVVEAARESIRLEVYIYRLSPIGETVRDALIRACQRGVKVFVMVDALGSISLPEKFWDPFIEAGGKFRWFNPIKLKRLGFRNHRKSLIVDEKIAF